jgi:hypothetical protein
MEDAVTQALELGTLAGTMDELHRQGFTERFQVVDGTIRAVGTGAILRAAGLVILQFHRFEGASDPDDMAILYAIEGEAGVRGTLADAYGVYADPAIGTALKDVPICRRAWRPRGT